MSNPFKIEGKPIIQFKPEADAWDDGYKAGRKELVEWLDEKMLTDDQTIIGEDGEEQIVSDRILISWVWQALRKEVGLE